MIRYALAALFAVAFLSCGNGRPEHLLEPAKMEVILWDVIRANTYVARYIGTDSSKKVKEEQAKYQQKVFTLHKVSKEDFYDSYDYYLAHPGQATVMLDSIISRAKAPQTTNRPVRMNPVPEK